jgi:hypothetical protein
VLRSGLSEISCLLSEVLNGRRRPISQAPGRQRMGLFCQLENKILSQSARQSQTLMDATGRFLKPTAQREFSYAALALEWSTRQ